MKKYILLNKSIFFPEEGILAFGDLHLGYEHMLKENGLTVPISQLKETKKEIEEIIKKLKNKNLKEIIILGDIKHHFSFKREENFEIKNFLEFLEKFVPKEKITLIKGNHEKVKVGNSEYKNFVIRGNIFFSHGDRKFRILENKKIKYLVVGHLHPAIILKEGVKREKYKCFLIGNWNKKETIILPSFLSLNEGTSIKEIKEEENYSIIPIKNIKKFKVHIVGKNKVYPYKKVEEN
jgi:uncharacterized protein